MSEKQFDSMRYLLKGLGDGLPTPKVVLERTRAHIAADIREEKRLHDRLPAHFIEQRDRIMARIDLLVDEHILAAHEEAGDA